MNNTGNPIGSSSPLDREDNSIIFDRLVLDEGEQVSDRLGVPRKTWRQIERGIEEQLIAGGRIFPDEAAGRAVAENEQYFYSESPDPNVSKTLWQRISESESRKVADDPSAELLAGFSRPGVIGIEYALVDALGRIAVALGSDGLTEVLGLRIAGSRLVAENGQLVIRDAQERRVLNFTTDGLVELLGLALPNAAFNNVESPGVDLAVTDIIGRIALGLGSDGTLEMLGMRLPGSTVLPQQIPGVEFAITDSNGRAVVIVFSDGTVEFNNVNPEPQPEPEPDPLDFPLGSDVMPDSSDGERYVTRRGELLPVNADMGTIAGWGSSSATQLGAAMSSVATELGVSYYNGGQGGESMLQIMARMGSIPFLCTAENNEIPESGAVLVTVSNSPLRFQLKTFTGTLNGVLGEFYYSDNAYYFERAESGSVVTVPGDSPFIPSDAEIHRDSVTFLWAGKADLNAQTDPAIVASYTDSAFDWLSHQNKKSIVLGHFVNTGISADSPVRAGIQQTNALHKKRYGPLFIDVSELITSAEWWNVIGVEPTADDLAEQALGNMPAGAARDAVHLSIESMNALAEIIKTRMIELNWYEV